MRKITFAIVGSGWRARFFIRIANELSEKYEVTGLLCRNNEKAEAFKKEYGIKTTLSELDIIDGKPDFIVVAVSKPSIYAVSNYWREKGFTVLCETPAGLTVEELLDIYNTKDNKGKLVVAEQYQYYPTYKKIIDTVLSGKIGEPVSTYISLAHDYHGASLMRLFLKESYKTPYKLHIKKYDIPVTKTGDRYFIYTDGEIINKSKLVVNVEFEDGKTAIFDFESEQYHSLIRHNSFKISGTRGEIINEKLWFLDEKNIGQEEILTKDIQAVRFEPEGTKFSEDEQAIEVLMEKTFLVSQDADEKIREWQQNNLRSALADAYFTILLSREEGEWIAAEKMPWQE